jgi:hypothetical protein
MRTTNIALGLVGLVGLVGCQQATRPKSVTAAEYGGRLPLVFTNATPEKLCGLYMSFDGARDYGDNWLATALPSGKSLELRVKPGTYKARWESCTKTRGVTPTLAATLWRERAFEVSQETQLYAYIADTTAPTKRAAVLGRDHHKVMFQGQTIAPIGTPQVVVAVAPPPAVVEAPAVAHFDDCVEARTVKAKGKRAKAAPIATGDPMRPSLRRLHDTTDKSVAYRVH